MVIFRQAYTFELEARDFQIIEMVPKAVTKKAQIILKKIIEE